MKKALDVAKEIFKEYAQSIEDKRYKTVFCESVGEEVDDGYTINYQTRELTLQASNPRSAAYAICQLRMYVNGQNPQQLFGANKPAYKLRPMWIECDKHVALSENVGCFLPAFFLDKKKENFDKFCRRLLELGFNAVILGSRSLSVENKSSVSFKELELLCRLFDDYGIKVIVKPVVYEIPGDKQLTLSPCDEKFCHRVATAFFDLRQAAPSLDTFFWESVYCDQDFHFHPSGRGHSKYEKTLMELRCVEECIGEGNTLIYYLPAENHEMAQKQAQWFERLLSEAGSKTICSFSCVSGKPSADHLAGHPFWEVLRHAKYPSGTSVMPLINSGGVSQGEGYWPNFPFELFEEYFSEQDRITIAGFVHLSRNVPNEGTLADASVWVAGMSMWRQCRPGLLLKTWYTAYYPDGDFGWFASLLKKARAAILELSAFTFSSEKCPSSKLVKSRVETVLALLKELECYLDEGIGRHPFDQFAMKEIFQLFIRDGRRVVLHYAHQNDVSISSSTGADFKGEGVWTELKSGGVGEGVASAGRVSFHENPLIGEKGTSSYKVHSELYRT